MAIKEERIDDSSQISAEIEQYVDDFADYSDFQLKAIIRDHPNDISGEAAEYVLRLNRASCFSAAKDQRALEVVVSPNVEGATCVELYETLVSQIEKKSYNAYKKRA